MTRIIARNARLLLDGYNISCRSNAATLSLSVETPEVTTFCDDTKNRLPDGISDSELSINGFYDEAVNQTDQLYSSYRGASALWGFFPAGFGACSFGRVMMGVLQDYEINLVVEDSATVAVTVTGCSFVERVKNLGEVSTACAASGSAATTSIDMGASSTTTVRGFIHFMDLSGSTVTASLQHSSDDVTFATLFDFGSASATGVAKQDSTTSASRYRRLLYEIGGGASAQFVIFCS